MKHILEQYREDAIPFVPAPRGAAALRVARTWSPAASRSPR
jgi:hypothetical protein